MNSPATRIMAPPAPSLSKNTGLTISIVICTRCRPGYLRKCLKAIQELEPGADEVLVVDNTTGDGETHAVAREFGARYVVEEMPGLSRARNRGMIECCSDIVAFVDDDAAPDVQWLKFLLAPFSDDAIAVVTGRIFTPESDPLNNSQESPRFLSNKDPRWFETATFGGMGLGSNMALRKSACAGRKIFDERLGRGAPFQIAEEYYAFASLISHGHTAAYVPNAVVFHPPLSRSNVEQEARNSISYWLLLFSEFPGQRLGLVRFLLRRLMRKRLTWPRDSQDPGEIITSGWRVLIKAGFRAVVLFFRTSKS